jgi:hypothetical protein
MAFTDCDEFFVVTDKGVASLTTLLREYEGFAGLAVNWQVLHNEELLCLNFVTERVPPA